MRRLASKRLLEDVFENAPIVVYLAPDLATARIYLRRLNDQELSFSLDSDDRLRDQQTGSKWNLITGEAVSGALQGEASAADNLDLLSLVRVGEVPA